jgi:hypothetical protein
MLLDSAFARQIRQALRRLRGDDRGMGNHIRLEALLHHRVTVSGELWPRFGVVGPRAEGLGDRARGGQTVEVVHVDSDHEHGVSVEARNHHAASVMRMSVTVSWEYDAE